MTFLKKLGSILAKGLALVAGLGPLIQPWLGSGSAAQTVNTVTNDFTLIAQQVLQVESVIQTPGSGAQKLQAAIPLVTSIIKTSEVVSGKKIANEALFTQACQEYTQATVDLLNSLHEDAVKTA